MNTYETDTFVEELVVKRKGLLNLLLSLLFVVVAAVLAFACFILLSAIFPAMLVILVVGAYLGIKFQGVEFEYSFTNGELDIDKIMAKRKRKTLVSVNYKQICVMAPYTAEYEGETKDYRVSEIIRAVSSKNSANQWFFIYEKQEGGYGFVVFQPSKRFREAMRKYMHSRLKGMEA